MYTRTKNGLAINQHKLRRRGKGQDIVAHHVRLLLRLGKKHITSHLTASQQNMTRNDTTQHDTSNHMKFFLSSSLPTLFSFPQSKKLKIAQPNQESSSALCELSRSWAAAE